MKKLPQNTIQCIVVIILLIVVFTQRCENQKLKKIDVEILIPEKKDSFIDSKPTEVISDSLFVKQLTDSIMKKYTENVKIQKEYITKYKIVTDTVKEIMYVEATTPRVYNKVFDNEDINIKYTALTRGTLEHLELDYTIKEKIIHTEVDIPNKNSLFIGGSMTNNFDTNKQSLNAEIGIVTKNKTMIQISYGTDKSVRVGYLKKLF